MFSEKSKKHAEACRFCWMCRHLCPVGLATGREANTPRAKGLLVAMAERGFPMEADTAAIMYECLLCGACTNDCVTGFDPLVYIREARTHAFVEDLAPKAAQDIAEKIFDTGNLFGLSERKLRVEGAAPGAEVLLWFGNTAHYHTPEIGRALASLLSKAGIAFQVLENEPASGVELLDVMGPVEDARQAAMACAERVNACGAKKMVVLDSYDAAAFLHEYADWGVALAPQVMTATAFVWELVREGRLAPKQVGGSAAYHDGSRLARDLDEHAPARGLLAAMGIEVKEMFQNRRLAKCCGSSLFGEYAPSLYAQVARGRWADAERTGAGLLTTACPQSYKALLPQTPEGWKLADLFMLLDASV